MQRHPCWLIMTLREGTPLLHGKRLARFFGLYVRKGKKPNQLRVAIRSGDTEIWRRELTRFGIIMKVEEER